MWNTKKTLIYCNHKACYYLPHRFFYQNITNFRQWKLLGKNLEIPWTQVTTGHLFVVSWGGKLSLDLAYKLCFFREISSPVFTSYRSLPRRWLMSSPFGSLCKKRWPSVNEMENKRKAKRQILNIHPSLLVFFITHNRSLFHSSSQGVSCWQTAESKALGIFKHQSVGYFYKGVSKAHTVVLLHYGYPQMPLNVVSQY